MKQEYQFTVDENSDSLVAKKALTNLKRMIKLGQLARKALDGIERNGFYPGLAPVIGKSQSSYSSEYQVGQNRLGKKCSTVDFVRLPKRLSISKDDLGDMSRLQVLFPSGTSASMLNQSNTTALHICGPMLTQVASGQSVYEIQEVERYAGDIRFNKNHISFIEPTLYGQGKVSRVYKDFKYPGAKEALEAFSKTISKIMTVEGPDMLASAKTLELQNWAWKWFLEDGHAERMFLDIHALSSVHEVMQR